MSTTRVERRFGFGNTLIVQLTATTEQRAQVLSQEYQLRKTVRTSFRIDSVNQDFMVFAQFSKIREDDFRYILKITSKELELHEKIFYADSSEQYLGTIKNSQTLKTVIKVVMDIAPKANMFESLHSDTDLIDFELRAEDGSLGFHRVVLSSWSPFFRTMFSGQWKENKEGHMEVKDTTRITLQHLKDYMYLQVLPGSGVEQLLQLARYYQMPELEQKCIDKLISSLEVQNTWEFMQFAVTQNLPKLFGQLMLSLNQVKIQEIGMHYTFDPTKETD